MSDISAVATKPSVLSLLPANGSTTPHAANAFHDLLAAATQRRPVEKRGAGRASSRPSVKPAEKRSAPADDSPAESVAAQATDDSDSPKKTRTRHDSKPQKDQAQDPTADPTASTSVAAQGQVREDKPASAEANPQAEEKASAEASAAEPTPAPASGGATAESQAKTKPQGIPDPEANSQPQETPESQAALNPQGTLDPQRVPEPQEAPEAQAAKPAEEAKVDPGAIAQAMEEARKAIKKEGEMKASSAGEAAEPQEAAAKTPATGVPAKGAPGVSGKPAAKSASRDSDTTPTTTHDDASPAAPQLGQAASLPAPVAEAADPAAAVAPKPTPVPTEASPSPTPIALTAPTSNAPQAAGAESAAPAQQSPTPDRQQVLDQVVLGLRGKVDAKNGQAEIHLNPPNLGTLTVTVRLQQGSVAAEFASPNALVRDLLNTHLGQLRSVLEGQGVPVDRLEVNPPAPPAAASMADASQPNGSPNHDGRSAGEYHQRPRQQGGHADPASAFAAALAGLQEPIDLVA